jgi:hypothetical protein
LVTILREEGLLALWSGWIPALLASLPFDGLSSYLRAGVARLLGIDLSQPSEEEFLAMEPQQQQEFQAQRARNGVIVLGVSSCIAQTCSIPFDLAKKRLQVESTVFPGGHQYPYEGTLDLFNTLLKEEGYSALFRGIIANHVKAIVTTFVFVLIEQRIKRYLAQLNDRQKRRWQVQVGVGSVAALVAFEAALYMIDARRDAAALAASPFRSRIPFL